MHCIIGADIGTTNSKAVAYSSSGEVLAQFNSTYRHLSPAEGFHELDPFVLFDAVLHVLSKTLHAVRGHTVAGIAFSSAMHGLMAVDHTGAPLTNLITWADLRSSSYAKTLKSSTQGFHIYQRTGAPVHAMTPLCKLMWMRENQADLFNAAYKFISIKEYILFRLFGRYVVDHSVASSTGLFDIYDLTWNTEALQLAGISQEKLSEHVPVDTVLTGLNDEFATALQVDKNMNFIIGGSDGCMAHIGSNAFRPRDVSLTIGTSGAVRIMNSKPVNDPRGRLFNYLVTDDLYLSGGPVNNGGNVLQWFSRNFLRKDFGTPSEVQAFINDAFQVPAGCDGLVFLPYIYGERAPVWDADAKGMFFGVTAHHTVSHFMRAAIEGVSYSLFSILNSIEEIAGPVNDIFVSGGFIRSREWVRLLADVLGKRLYVTHGEDSSAAGAAIIGLKQLGMIQNFEEASSFFTSKEMYEPDLGNHEVYRRNYEVYSKLYDKFKDVNN